MENRRTKYTKSKVVKNNNLVIDVNFDISTLDLMCSYIISDNKNIRRASIINLRNLLYIVDMNNYNGDKDRLARIDFIKKGIEARLVQGLTKKSLILQYISGGFGMVNEIGDALPEINNSELDWINSTVSETLKYSIIYNDIDRGLSLLTKFKSVDYINRGPIVKEIEQWINGMQVKFRKARSENMDEIRFGLEGDDYDNSVRETWRKLISPSNKLVFGSQALNMLTGGGVESGRVYTLLGLPGEGKSATLLDMALELKKYNAGYVCKDPTKKPCVVLLTMENSVKEDIERLFSMVTGRSMIEFTEEEALEILKSQGRLDVTPDDPINLFILFKPNLSVDTGYLYDMVEDLEDEGYETICVLQDYLKRIRSVDGTFGGDLRLQLGAIVNEFKVFATIKDIPVITASQLNRDATKHIDEARQLSKGDLVRLLGRSNVGESNLILENSDWIALIAPEYDMEGTKYLGIQRCKSRYYIPNEFTYAYIPYVGSTMKLQEDFESMVPCHKITMRENAISNGGINANNVGVVNSIREFTEVNNIKLPTNDTPNLFLNANAMVAMMMTQKTLMCRTITK